ncbi:MAG: glycosyltransferase [Candidatus Margulisbacteria bacterium]|nr:glycosyltransferase [Candidatus Margulisiibacteriota bacterium]
MKIGFNINISFPSGGATTNRVFTLAKGLEEQGNIIKVYCLRPTENKNNRLNKNKKGNYNNINYHYTPFSIFRSKNKFIRGIWVFSGFLNFLFLFLYDSRKMKYDYIISSTSNIVSNLVIKTMCKLTKTKFILAIDEYPHVVRTPRKYPNWFNKFYIKWFHLFFDAYIVMTSVLIKYYKQYSKLEAAFIHVPMTVEMERFEKKPSIPSELVNIKYIAYCGSLGQNDKDGVPILIKAFAKVKEKLNNEERNLKLVIIGSVSSEKDRIKEDELKQLVSELGVKNDVIFTGKIHKDEMPNYLCNAYALCLARPNNIQAQGGFPTKLGEYLATGNPVVVTSVGEIPVYLDEKSAYIAEPDSVEDFANKLYKCLGDPEASIIGEKGKEIANKNFNYKTQGFNLHNFLLKLNK